MFLYTVLSGDIFVLIFSGVCVCVSVPKAMKERRKVPSQKLKKVRTYIILERLCDDIVAMFCAKKNNVFSLKPNVTTGSACSKQFMDTKDLANASVKSFELAVTVKPSVVDSQVYPAHCNAEQIPEEVPLCLPGTALTCFCLY